MPRKARSCSSAVLIEDAPGIWRVATAITRLPAANSASSAVRAAAGMAVHRLSSPSGAPLVMIIRLPWSSSARTETRRRS